MIGVYRTPDGHFAGLPDFTFEPRYVEIDGLRMHYIEEGRGDPILLLHGKPTWSFLYRKMIPALRGRFRCVAPDYRVVAALIPGSQLARIRGADHFLQEERGPEIAKEILAFVPD